MRHTIEHVFDTSPERLWEVFFFDEDYARGLYERMRLTVVRRDLQREGEGPNLIVRRKLQLAADRELPGALKRLFQGTSTVTEIGEFNAALRRYSVTIQVPVIGNLVDYGGEYTWDILPSGQLRRVWKGHCDARIPLVGGKLEAYLLGEIEKSMAENFAYTRDWLKAHPAS
ncbi:Protein of unknown function [Nannocystis exedens]|uniref:DUF2505 domain-containing protein n=1 Tax=Nannocystis exedens TaxID=54 RepID=A0A1I1SZL4_9BACT|nr:DUF2505 domain-containing protein [Nannocystis exedens]PCC66880.1 hypothetical protein NAEX_09476 [Nannocystis exedens]SFD51889.1 Protein of unknown function [Nannocystis exedens]